MIPSRSILFHPILLYSFPFLFTHSIPSLPIPSFVYLTLFERHKYVVPSIFIWVLKVLILEPFNDLQLFLKLTYIVDLSTLAQYSLTFVVKVSPKL